VKKIEICKSRAKGKVTREKGKENKGYVPSPWKGEGDLEQ